MNLDVFLEGVSDNQREIILFWYDQLMTYPEVECKIRYRIPFFYYHSWLLYLNPKKEIDGIELVFLQGKNMHDESGLLQVRGRKQVAGILMDTIDESILDTVLELFAQAIIIDEDFSDKKKK